MSALEIEEKALRLSDEEKLGLIVKLEESMAPPAGDPPEWHREVLADRMQRIETGEASYRPWSDVRKTLGLK